MTFDERVKKAKEIEEWLNGAQPGHSSQIIKALLLLAEQNEIIIKCSGWNKPGE